MQMIARSRGFSPDIATVGCALAYALIDLAQQLMLFPV
jgi:hypothetical protein